ncbi:hypothetical protein AO826_12040 [Xanthomonas phaseoli pv. manihotis]|nr:hypothetical protein AO826_12040 [Xanthomonas phaseoli pv. manihotis]
MLVLLVGVDARLRAELIEPRQCVLEQWVIAQPRFLLRIKGVPPALYKLLMSDQ